MVLLLAAIVMAGPTFAQQQEPEAKPSAPPATASSPQDDSPTLPVSLDKIKGALTQGAAEPLLGLDNTPHFKLEVREKQKISLDDLITAMDFSSGPAVSGGSYGFEQNRLAFPAVDNPLRQPYAAFSQSELLTIVIQNLAAKYLGGKALSAVTTAQRAGAEQAARHEVQHAIADYCAAQPNGGAGIQLCTISPASR